MRPPDAVDDPATGPRTGSLRDRLVRRVVGPLALTWLLGTLLMTAVSRHFTQQAFDRTLLDDAYALASHVHFSEPSGLLLGLSANETDTLLFDRDEVLFFAVFHPDGRLIAGHPQLRLPDLPPMHPPVFTEMQLREYRLRVLVLARITPQPYKIVIGQTVRSQDRLFAALLVYSLLPQLLLLLVLAWWLRRAIREDLQPLGDLQQALARRDPKDLSALALPLQPQELRQLGNTVNSLLQRIARTVQGHREFAGNVAHELRTPLAGIRALLEYGLAQDRPEVWRSQLEQIREREQKASHRIDQLLALALVVEAREVLRPAALRLDQHVREAFLRHLRRADQYGVDLGVRGIDQEIEVLAQASLVDGVLDNLIDNALRHGRPPGGETPQVTVEIAREPDGRVRLSVVDNGAGMDRHEAERLRQRWARGEAAEPGGSTGLGLHIVSEYARSLGAELRIEAALAAPTVQPASGEPAEGAMLAGSRVSLLLATGAGYDPAR